MFANDLVLDGASGADTTYRLQSYDGNGGSRRIDTATTLAAPSVLTIKHSTSGKGTAAIDRHLVQIQKTITGSQGPVTLTCNFTVAVPRDVAVTPTIVKDAIVNIVDLLTDGQIASVATTANIDSLLRGEA